MILLHQLRTSPYSRFGGKRYGNDNDTENFSSSGWS